MPELSSEARCPEWGSLLFKVRDDGCLEIACSRCRDADRRAGRGTWLVLHVYGPDGELVDTEHLAPLRASPR